MNIPAKFVKQVSKNLKTYQNLVQRLKNQEVNETDTVKVINDILSDVFGYDKYTEITSEHSIRGTFCDLAIKDNSDEIYMLIEAKGVSIQLKENHVTQAINYGANERVKWIVLTNAEYWKVYKIKFSQPIERKLVLEFNFLTLNPKSPKDLELMFVVSKMGKLKSAIDELYSKNQIKNKYVIASLINSIDIYKAIRSNLRRYFDNTVKITDDEIADFIQNDIFKREVLDSDDAKDAQKALKKAERKLCRAKQKKGASNELS